MKRFYDMELETTSLKEKLGASDKERKELVDKLNAIYREQQKVRSDIEDELNYRLEQKDKEIRKLKEELQSSDHQHKQQMDSLKLSNKNDLEVIQQKVELAMGKKREIID